MLLSKHFVLLKVEGFVKSIFFNFFYDLNFVINFIKLFENQSILRTFRGHLNDLKSQDFNNISFKIIKRRGFYAKHTYMKNSKLKWKWQKELNSWTPPPSHYKENFFLRRVYICGRRGLNMVEILWEGSDASKSVL